MRYIPTSAKSVRKRDTGLAVNWPAWEVLGGVMGYSLVKSDTRKDPIDQFGRSWVLKVPIRQVLGGIIGNTLVRSDTKSDPLTSSGGPRCFQFVKV